MDQSLQLGSFILKAADKGLKLAAALSHFGSGQRIRELASKVSLSATILTEVGREVNHNAEYFKNTLQEKFQIVTIKCEKDFERVLGAVEKANTWMKDESDEGLIEVPPKKPWKRLLWAMSMNEREFDDFDDSLDESLDQAAMLQDIIALVVLQIHGQGRALTTAEEFRLRRMKKNMGELLEALRDANVGSVMAFSLIEKSKAANYTQALETIKDDAKEAVSPDNASITTASVTIRDPSMDNLEVSAEKEKPTLIAEPQVVIKMEPISPYQESDIFEMYRASDNVQGSTKRTIFRLFGIPLKVERIQKETLPWQEKTDRIPATQDGIKDFLQKSKTNTAGSEQSTLEVLINASPVLSSAIYALVENRNDGRRQYQSHKWSLEHLAPVEGQGKPTSRFWKKKTKSNSGYIVILKGESKAQPPGPPRPPVWPGGAPCGKPPIIIMDSPQEKKPAAQIQLTQEETEQVVGEFLASISTLYDGIPIEQRGAALQAITLCDEDDDGYDSDDTSSSGSRSLVDD